MGDNNWRPTPIVWFVLLSGCVFFIFNVAQIKKYSQIAGMPKQKIPVYDEHIKGFLVKEQGCTIPEMNFMDSSIKEFIFKETMEKCNNGMPPLVDSNFTSIYILESSMLNYSINDTESLKCCYQPFYRVAPEKKGNEDSVIYDKVCHNFTNSVDIKDEFIRVLCKYNEIEIYKDFFNFVPLINNSKVNVVPSNQLNVLMIGIDAVSRLNFYRQMPKTRKLLEKFNAIEMLGYNKVGDNTFPNLIPVLGGLSEDELKEICWTNQSSYFDKCPFIWNNFKEAGFTTSFAEDSSWMGLFYYTRKGFVKQPTDYYWDTFDKTAQKEIGNNHRANVNQCIGSRKVYKTLLQYIIKFTNAMHTNQKPFFSFFWGSTLSHDFLNLPKLGDTEYANVLKYLKETGVLNKTALILLSDHGIRWGSIRSTYQGRMEERLPFVYIVLPDWYVNQNDLLINNLKLNTRKLTTPFDLHETIKDLVNSTKLTKDFLIKRSENASFQRGYSLFDKIHGNRTCKEAGISPHWCTCQITKKLELDDPNVIESANFTVHDVINEKLTGYSDCAPLELDSILDGRLQMNTEDMNQNHYSEDYAVTFQTKPGGGVFESTIRKYTKPDGGYYFNVTGTVSRINLYGQQSNCITDFHLKLYCYCKYLLST